MATGIVDERIRRAARVVVAVSFAAVGVAGSASPLSATVSITTKYRYNADGALTAVTKDSPSGSETTYLTFLTNNCHAHAFSILESLGLRRSLRSYAGF